MTLLTRVICCAFVLSLLSTCSATSVQRSLLRHASFRGFEAKGMVGESIDAARTKYGPPFHVTAMKDDDPRTFHDVPVAGKLVYFFERDRTNYTIDVPAGSEVAQSNVGPVNVTRYDRQKRVAICTLAFLVDPTTRKIVGYDISGNCI